jgi:hypothetical protein
MPQTASQGARPVIRGFALTKNTVCSAVVVIETAPHGEARRTLQRPG